MSNIDLFASQRIPKNQITNQSVSHSRLIRETYGICSDDLVDDLVGTYIFTYWEHTPTGEMNKKAISSYDYDHAYIHRVKRMHYTGMHQDLPTFMSVKSSTDPLHTKQLILVRKDLNMPVGKLAAQVAHASVAVMLDTIWNVDYLGFKDWTSTESNIMGEVMANWLNGSFTKIVLQVNNLNQLHKYHDIAKDLGLPCSLITDNGNTVFNGEQTVTCCAIGPYWNPVLDSHFGKLRLYH